MAKNMEDNMGTGDTYQHDGPRISGSNGPGHDRPQRDYGN